jgi:L-methionine (R)-S-oxide reductase
MQEAFNRALAEIDPIARAKDPSVERLKKIAAVLQRLPRYTGVYFYELSGERLLLVAHAGRDTEHVDIPIGEGICGLSARTRESVVIDDVKEDPRYLACNLETASEIVVPIMNGSTYHAQIDVDSDARAAFGSADREFLTRVATVLVPLFPTASN